MFSAFRLFFAGVIACAVTLPAMGAEPYDLVLAGGRVMDPATRLDARRNVGITGDKIVAISEQDLAGKATIDVAGLVLAPGFIDLHQHGFKPSDLRLKAQDGVTTALELEIGVFPVGAWYEGMQGKAPVNYGATVSHPGARVAAFRPELTVPPETSFTSVAGVLGAAAPRELAALVAAVERGIREGALGVGFGIHYTPAAQPSEIETVFRTAARAKLPVFVHTRAFGIGAIHEALLTAEKAGASLHIVHVGSSGLNDLPEVLRLIDAKRSAGLDVTTEVYPYTAASTRLESAMFNDGWQENLRIDYGDLVWVASGERLTQETFAKYRAQGGWVIMHMMKEENISRAIAHPGVIIASDGVPFVDGAGHPRGAGSFARVLGRYVREQRALSLMDALAKMTILPARRLDHVPAMRNKGRIAVGADADITVFDAATISDRATFEKPTTPSAGIVHVLVNGRLVVRDGEFVPALAAGLPVRLTPR